MIIASEDNERIVDIGSSTNLFSLYSTAEARLGFFKGKVSLALEFLKTGECKSQDCTKAARQINLIRDELSKYPPEDAVYDINDRNKEAPWKGNISNIVTSCANLYITADGKDMLYELVCVLTYAGLKDMAVHAR